jgi:adenylate cyclase
VAYITRRLPFAMAETTTEERWREALLGIPPEHLAMRRFMARLPGSPRCKNCAAPFGGAGSAVARAMGFRRWARNPTFCNQCIGNVASRGIGGAEVEISMLFADIRGSTTLAESMTASAFAALLDRFYVSATDVLVREDAMVDKFVGDEVVALFLPAFAGSRHADHAIRAAADLLLETGHDGPEGSWVPVGAGVHTGIAYVGAVGSEHVTDVTALGDAVNTTARLASAAGAGEILVTEPAAEAAGLRTDGLELRSLALKGKSQEVRAWSLGLGDGIGARLSRP